MRLQDTYKLDPETLSRGNLPGKCTKVSSLKKRKQTSSNSQSPFSVVMDHGSETVQLRHLWLCLFWCFENSLGGWSHPSQGAMISSSSTLQLHNSLLWWLFQSVALFLFCDLPVRFGWITWLLVFICEMGANSTCHRKVFWELHRWYLWYCDVI